MGLLRRLLGTGPSADPADALVDYLSGRSLDDRRFMAGVLYGGPHSLKVCKWVLSQPDCDTGTASMLLWEFGWPHGLLRSDWPAGDAVKRELIAFIVDRWRRQLFAPAVFAFDPREHARLLRRELKRMGLQDPFGIPDEAWKPIAGRSPEPSPEVVRQARSFMDGRLGRLRLADLAAIDPEKRSR